MGFFDKLFGRDEASSSSKSRFTVEDKRGNQHEVFVLQDGSLRVTGGVLYSQPPSDVVDLYLSGKATDPMGYNNLGNQFSRSDDFEKAVWCYDKAIDLCPEYSTAYCGRGGTSLSATSSKPFQISASHSALSLATQQPCVTADWYTFGLANSPIVDCNAAIEGRPDYERAYSHRGIAYQELGNYEQAMKNSTAVSIQRLAQPVTCVAWLWQK